MENSNKNFHGISRRKFLATTGGATLFISGYVMLPKLSEFGSTEELVEQKVNAWVSITTEGKITIYNPAAEMGQGSMTAVPVLIAEEMDANWDDVTIENSPIEPEIYGIGWSRGGTKSMITVGSRTVRGYYMPLREAGAQIRQGFLKNASEKWNIPIEELTTNPSKVVHAKSGRKLSYGEIAAFGDFTSLPEFSTDHLKDPSTFRLIGKVLPRFDIPAKTNGTAQYAMDVSLPGMLYGFINRSPVNGAAPNLTNESEIRSISGVREVVKLNHGIGVIVESIEVGLKVKTQLKIEWSKSMADIHDSEKDLKSYIIEADKDDGKNIVNEGDTDITLSNAKTTFKANFFNAYNYHGQMEPLNAVVSVSSDRKSAELWIGSQAPDSARNAVAKVLGISRTMVKMNHLYLGGGFGRRSMSDYAEECAHLAKSVDNPVKLIWTREDDVQYGAFRPQCLQQLEAGLDDKGMITAWKHKTIGPGDGLLTSGAGIAYYNIPNKKITLKNIDHGIRTKHWRAVGHGPNKYAIETFIDQIARSQNLDPYQYRRQLMSNDPKAQRVLDKVVEMAEWKSKPENGRGMGIAFAERSGSYAAGIAEISVDTENGIIKTHRFWCAVDSGVVVQPDNAIAQTEGSIIMGLSSTLKERISITNGKVDQSNYHDYPVLRMSESPESIDVEFLESSDPPAGIGEAGLPVVGGAIASAFAALTGKYLYNMPFTPESVLQTLNG